MIDKNEAANADLLAAAINKQFEKMQDLIKGSATKEDWAKMVVENKDLLSQMDVTNAKQADIQKQLEKATDVAKIQGEKLTQIISNFGSNFKAPKTFGSEVERKIVKEGSFDDFIKGNTNKGRIEISTKDLDFGTADNVAAAQQPYMPFAAPQQVPLEQFDIRLVLPTGTINDMFLEYPAVKAWTDATAAVAENADAPQTEATFEMKTANATRIAASMKISRTALRNSSWLSNFIRNQMLAYLIKVLNTQSIVGSGLTVNLEGLYTNAAANNAFNAATNFGTVSDNPTIFDVMRAAMGDMNLAHFNANHALLNPVDAAIAAITKNSMADYIDPKSFLNPNNQGYVGNWGMNNVETADIAANTLLIADIAPSNMQLLFNGPIEVLVSDSDDDNFTKDFVTVKVQVQALLPVYQGGSIMAVTDIDAAITAMTIV